MNALHCSGFSQKIPNFGLVYFSYRQKNPSTSNKFKSQTNDIFKLFRHNCNHQQGFLKQKNFAVHRCGFNLKLPQHIYFECCFWM